MSRPAAIWRGAPPVQPTEVALLPYHPEVFGKLGPAALEDPQLNEVALRHPACAVALLTRHYVQTQSRLEPSLAGAGEAVYHLLGWAEREGRPLKAPQDFYRRILVRDTYWGYRHARRTGDKALLVEAESWSRDRRKDYAAAAALFLMRHPREPVSPYRDLLLSHPFYAYLALPRLHPRGFRVSAADVADPKWACHFALSRFSAGQGDYLPCVLRDPAWAVELAQAAGWTKDPGRSARLMRQLIDTGAKNGELLARALYALKGGPDAAGGSTVPPALRSGRSAEARVLQALNRDKNSSLWRPSPTQIESAAFRRIVGPPQFTERGFARGTVMDSVGPGFAEIKSGGSVLNSTYQLRLQAYRAVAEERNLKIYTSRPVDVAFGKWLGPLGVAIEPLPEL